jgi:PAS domain S-box-containing protein
MAKELGLIDNLGNCQIARYRTMKNRAGRSRVLELEQFSAQVKAMSAHLDHLRRGQGKASESHRRRLDETAVALDTSMEELRVAEEELRQQSEELELSRLEVELERRRYRDLFDCAPNGYLVTDKHGKILEANRAAAALLGLPQRFLAGKPLANYVADKDRRTFRLQLAQLSEVGRCADWDLRIRPPRGEAFDATLSVAIVRDREGEPVSLRWMMHDITVRKRVEEQVRTLNAELECQVRHRTEELETALADVSYLHEVATRLSSSLELEPLLEEILAVVARFMGAERGALLMYDGGSDELVLSANTGLTEAFTGQLGRIPRDARPWWPVLGMGASVIVADVEVEEVSEELRAAMRAGDVRAIVAVPLIARRGDFLGTIAEFFAEPHRPPGRRVDLIELYARQAADFIEAARLRREQRESARRQEEFLATLAHELRNPLATIVAAAEALRPDAIEAAVSDEVRELLLRQARQMTLLVDDLLDASRVRQGRVGLRKEPVALGEVVARAIESVRPRIAAGQQELAIELPPDPVWLEADPTRLVQVLANLLSNAAKYTGSGGRITLAASRDGEEAVVRVRDTGIGIARELLPRVFDLFVRGDEASGRAVEGLGIGLALVKRLVEEHGGSVTARSDGPGQGSEFEVRLPIGLPTVEGQAAGGVVPASSPSPRSIQILVVDDQRDMACSLARLLEGWGHEVDVAADGPSALELALARRPEVVLMDIGLPGMDGLEVARRLREQGVAARLVALTGYGQEEDRLSSLACGFDHHLVKPVDLDELRELIEGASPDRLAVLPCPPG